MKKEIIKQTVVLQPITDTWRDVYNAIEGLSEEDFAIMSKVISEDLPLRPRKVL